MFQKGKASDGGGEASCGGEAFNTWRGCWTSWRRRGMASFLCEILSQFLCEIKFALLLDLHTYFIQTVGESVCNVCGKQFMAENALYDHNWGVQTEVKSPCNDCDKIFRNETKLAHHIRDAVKLDFRKNLGIWPNQRTPSPLVGPPKMKTS